MELFHPRDVHSPLVLVLRGLARTLLSRLILEPRERCWAGRRALQSRCLSVCFLPGALIRWLSSMLFGWEVDGANAPVGPVKHPPAHSNGLGRLSSAYSKGWSCQRPCSGTTLATDTQDLLERVAPPLPTQIPDLFVQLVC